MQIRIKIRTKFHLICDFLTSDVKRFYGRLSHGLGRRDFDTSPETADYEFLSYFSKLSRDNSIEEQSKKV
jgi:hypothetical protein